MLGKPHVFVVHGFLGRGVWKCESRSCVLPIHEESGCFAGCVSCGTKDGRRQITHHDSSVVTSDDSPGISRKGYTAKIHTGIDERQEGGSIIVCNGPAADKCLGVSIDADRCAGRIGAAAVIQIEKRTGLGPHPGKQKTRQVAVPRGQQKKTLCTFRSDFRGIWNPGTFNSRLKKRTGLGPHPTLEKSQFWPLFRSMSGALNLAICRAAKGGNKK